jgi:hypothetical protein
MMTAEQSAQVATLLRGGQAARIFDLWEQHLSDRFADGDDGFQLYVECSKLVVVNAPEHHEEFKRRFGNLPSEEAILRGLGLKPLFGVPKKRR